MSELSDREIKLKEVRDLSPSQMQLELFSVYRSLPLRDAIYPPDVIPSRLSKVKRAKHYKQMSDRANIRADSDLVWAKTDLLEELLARAEITDAFKRSIKEQFSRGFRFGLAYYDPIYNILELDKDRPTTDGIFSDNPLDRMIIERRFYSMKLGELEDLQQSFDRERRFHSGNFEHFQNELIQAESFLQVFRDDFTHQYGEPLTPLQESPRG